MGVGGRITVKRAPSGQRYFDGSDVRAVLQPGFDAAARRTVVDCRVSSPGQKEDLASQVAAMEQFCLAQGLAVNEWVSEIGGGMSLRRKKCLAVMDAIETGDIGVPDAYPALADEACRQAAERQAGL